MATGDGYNETIRSAMVELTAALGSNTELETTLASVTAAAVTLMDGVDYADVLLINNGHFRSVTPTAPLVIDLDAVQLRLNEGPCLQAAVDDELVVRCPDLRTDERWPGFASAAVAAGVHSMLSFQLYSHRGGAGALNLFCRQASTVDAATEAIGAMLATHAAVALVAAETRHQFHSALASRDVIGQAKGILMERFKVDAVRAFELLTKLSQNTNTPLRIVAQKLVDS